DLSKLEIPENAKSVVFNSKGALNDLTKNSFELNFSGLTGVGGSSFDNVSVDISGLTQYATNSTVEGKATNGNSAGTLSGYSIDKNGVITGTYTNGEKRTMAQVVLAQFDNPAGLEKVGDNLYAATNNSGEFDGIGEAGSFSTGVLEMSNVDLSSEFTDMIVTQRGFQANSRIITVSDEMLQELTNLKR
ncbi:MAG: flagellar hook-basal body complex protein, partial [Cellulosilyticum sp.]|nr:flagellar hook-basal body complex protein [Cellulosilyticum sp.]